jgi:hypothetical protein
VRTALLVRAIRHCATRSKGAGDCIRPPPPPGMGGGGGGAGRGGGGRGGGLPCRQVADRVVGRAASPLAARCAHAVLADHNLNIIYYITLL